MNKNLTKTISELHWPGKRLPVPIHTATARLRERYLTPSTPPDAWLNRLYWGDNLQVIAHLLDDFRGKIDLIYIDPPYNSKSNYKKEIVLRGAKEKKSISFEEQQYSDVWTNEEYLQFMYDRLTLLRDLLSDTGTIYLHCDWHQSHYLRVIMDEIFGPDHFQAELIWRYSWGVRTEKCWNKKHDTIFMYTKSEKFTFNAEDVLEEREISKATADRLKYKGALISDGNKGRGDKKSALPSDVFYIPTINGMAHERQNYPTQKPEELLEKLIKASSNPGDLIFDCFMGSGTTPAVAMKLGRRFIGADVNLNAVHTATKRLIAKQTDNPAGFEVYHINDYTSPKESEADTSIENGRLIIHRFKPYNLMQRLSIANEAVEDWRQLTDSVLIDWNFDGAVLRPALADLPAQNGLVAGVYDVPPTAGIIKIKLTDLLSEPLEKEIRI